MGRGRATDRMSECVLPVTHTSISQGPPSQRPAVGPLSCYLGIRHHLGISSCHCRTMTLCPQLLGKELIAKLSLCVILATAGPQSVVLHLLPPSLLHSSERGTEERRQAAFLSRVPVGRTCSRATAVVLVTLLTRFPGTIQILCSVNLASAINILGDY